MINLTKYIKYYLIKVKIKYTITVNFNIWEFMHP